MNSLRGRIIRMMCIAILPMNILIIFCANRLVASYRAETKNASQSVLSSMANNLEDRFALLETDIGEMENEMQSIFKNMSENGYGSIHNFHVITELKRINNRIRYSDGAFVFYPDGMRVLLNDKERLYGEDYIECLKMLENQDPASFSQGSIYTEVYAGRHCMIIPYQYEQVWFGFIISMDRILEELRDDSVFANKNVWIQKTSSGEIISLENIKEDTGVISQQEFADGGFRLCCGWKDWRGLAALWGIQGGIYLVGIITLLIFPLTWRYLKKIVVTPLENLENGMQEIENENLEFRLDTDEKVTDFQFVNQSFNNMVEEIGVLRIEAYEKELEKMDIEAVNLRLQINPHFLLNCLNMIDSFAKSGNIKGIREFAIYLSEYFRYSLGRSSHLVILRQELECVENYLEIQKIRYPGLFLATYNIEEGLMDALIPQMLLINFVENSIKYGLNMNGQIEIILIASRREEHLSISVIDTGNGMDEERLEAVQNGDVIEDRTGKHIGLWNCRRRLNMLYQEEADLHIVSAPGKGTQIYVEIPLQKEEKV